MAKGKGKRGSAGNAVPAGDFPTNKSKSQTDAAPQLEGNAFAGLRERIEQKLKDESAGKQKPKNKAKNAPAEAPKKENGPPPKSKPKGDSDKNKGKKRDRNGEVIARDEKKAGKDKQPKAGDKKAAGSNEDTLRQEIMALGGTQEDFDLLAGVGSESEVEDAADSSSKKSNKKSDDASLRRELSSMLASAGQVAPEDLKDAEEEDQEDVEGDSAAEDAESSDGREGEDEDDENISDVEEEVPPAPSAKPAKEQPKKETSKPAESASILPKEYSQLTVSPRPDWFSTPLPPTSVSKQANPVPRHLVDRIYEYAKSLLEKESKMYAEAQQKAASSSHKFYTTIMASGTLSDKISALTLAIQESPLHNTKAMENLIALGKKRSRTQAVEVLRSLKDMFAQGTLLPSDRRLKTFANQPPLVAALQGASNKWSEKDPLPGGLQQSHIIVWAFENFLKEQFFEVLQILEVWCNDEIEFSRSRAVSYVFELLKERPEQESNLLRLLVNKLGDPGKKIASRASYLLMQLEQTHPMMKPTIVRAVEEVLFRPGQSQHAKYYAIITLNQTVLSAKEEKVAIQLLDIYFSLFVSLLQPVKPAKHQNKHHGKFNKKGGKGPSKQEIEKGQAQEEEMQDKLTSAVLTGVNRAYPFTASDTERLTKHIDTLFRITHSSNFNTSIQALMLIQQLTSSHQVSADRFYRTLYESLLDPRVATTSKQVLYLNLLYKALKNDLNVRRVKAFIKRIVQVLGLHQPSFICGIFYLIRELEKTFTGVQSLFDQPEENEDDEEEVFRDVPDEDEKQDEPEIPQSKPQKPTNGYDPRKRDPEHSNADKSCLWELLPYLSHYHPSVSVNASYLLEHEPMPGKPDLTLHTLTHFLDRFVYRTPKATTSARGASIMQPLAGSDAADRLVAAGKERQYVPLNTEAFWKKKSDEVAAEDVFFHEYFNRLGKDKEKARKEKSRKDTDVADEDGDLSEPESEIWKALVDSRPELEGGDGDDDLDLDDLDSAYGEEDDDEGEEAEPEGEPEAGDEDVIFNDESDEMEEAGEAEAAEKEDQASDDEDDFDMDVSDDEAFLGSDEDVPLDMGGSDEEPAKDEGASERKKKRKLKHLPTFASADDYAALLAGEEDGMQSV